LSQQETTEKIGASVSYLSQLEKNKRKGSLDALTAIAKVLSIFPEHIVSSQA
jgi:transcriptional regulator with XRE-family HTH domain